MLNPDTGTGADLCKLRLAAVVVIDDASNAVPLAKALEAGGVKAIELTLRTSCAIDAVRAIAEEVPSVRVGAGTVLSPAQVAQVADAGGHFAVAPGTNPDVMRAAADAGLPFGPGVMTPTDIDVAVGHGCRLLKFFPASSSGGLPHLRNIAAPYAHFGLKFIPLGGINAANLKEYLEEPLVGAVGGSWLAPRDAIAAKAWPQIEANAREASALASG